MAKIKILMVCLGNICRSPVAEGIMRSIAVEKGLELHIDSAGTSGHHSGENPDRRSQRNALKNGVDISKQVSRKFGVRDFDEFDRIFVMDESNYRDVICLAKTDTHKMKVSFLLDALYPGKKMPVPDPWYGGDEGFEEVFQLIKKACLKISESL